MSNDNPHDTFEEGHQNGMAAGQFSLAGKMRVLIAALLTAKEKEDHGAFWDTVKIIKIVLGQYQNFSEKEWHVFRCPRTNNSLKAVADRRVADAAPDMLAALEKVLDEEELACDVHDAVTRAIIKAKGDFK